MDAISPKGKLVAVDFRQSKDIDEALATLYQLRRDGKIAGMLFAVKVTGENKPRFGSAGCCAKDGLAASGVATQLLRAVMDKSMNQ